MPVPAEATPQPGERSLPLPSAPSPLGRLKTVMQKKVTIATNAAFHATYLPSWQSTCELTVEGRRLFVRNATTLAQKLAPLKSTCESIQEKIPIVECSATIPALKHWKETLLLARNANTHAGRLMNWGIT